MKPMTKMIKKANVALLLGFSAFAVLAADVQPTADAAATTAPAVSDDKSTAVVKSAAPAKIVQKPLWSYQPVRAVEVPEVKNKHWVRTPIDAFVFNGQIGRERPEACAGYRSRIIHSSAPHSMPGVLFRRRTR